VQVVFPATCAEVVLAAQVVLLLAVPSLHQVTANFTE
jgi:hypothetical protein